jgi:pyruvate dehydrogenase E2 component (dihydrolipoamide acetyltransferase)
MEAGVVARWHKQPGDRISPGDYICDIETDKAVVGFEAQEEAYLAAIIVPGGSSSLPVGTPLGVTVEDESEIAAAAEWAKTLSSSPAAAPAASAAPVPVAAAAAAPAPVAAAPVAVATAAATQSGPATHKLPFSPAVAHMLATLRIDPASVVATGPKGRLLKGDVLAALANNTAVIRPAAAAAAAAPAAAKPAAKPAAAAAAAGARPGVSARRQAARTHTDVPLSAAAAPIFAAVAQHKRLTPHMYLQAEVPSAALRNFAAASGISADAVIVRAGAHALAASGVLAADQAVHARVRLCSSSSSGSETTTTEVGPRGAAYIPHAATAPLTLIDKAVTGGGVGAKTDADIAAAPAAAVAFTFLAGPDATPVPFGADILPPGSIAAVTVGAPAAVVRTHSGLVVDVDAGADGALPGDAAAAAVVEMTYVTLTVDATAVDEVQAAKMLQKIAQAVQNPVTMLL